MTNDIKVEGRRLFEERLKFGKQYIVYPSEHEAVAHALMDGHTHLIQHFSSSPRFFFTATQGSSGKTAATQVSYFFVQNPIMATESGAGLIIPDCGDTDSSAAPSALEHGAYIPLDHHTFLQ